MASPCSTLLRVAGLCAASPLVFATTYTALAGGDGGTGFDLDCGANLSLIGIQGTAGNLIDSVQGICAQFNADGSLLGRKLLTGKAGGTGGGSYQLLCSNGTTVRGISGHAATYVDNLKLHCSGATPEFTESAGNPAVVGAGQWFALGCPAQQDARLVRGRSGVWVDAIGLGCKQAERLRVAAVRIAAQARLGQTAPLTVTMSLVPLESIDVGLASSNPNLATSAGAVTIGTATTQATASVAASTIGCARVTASYKGSSASADLVVHSAASPALAVKGPLSLKRYGPAGTLTISIPAPSPQYTPIALDFFGPSSGPLGPFVRLSTSVASIAPNALSTTVQVTPSSPGCASIRVGIGKVGGASVIHSVMVVE